ncbi:MAG: ABC transporter permease [Chloroflexota bacterium]|nr:ABC transporter permease [Chloroflexota bacterium]
MAQQTRTLRGNVAEQPLATEESRKQAQLRGQLSSTQGFYQRAWRRFRKNQVSMIALGVAVLIVLFALGAGLISEYVTGVSYAQGDLRNKLQGPLIEGHPLGTDANGRDLLTRLAYGGRISLLVASLATVAILLIGGAVGAIAGFFGGAIDSFLMRLVDVMLSLPELAILLLISAIYTPGPVGLALIIAATGWTGFARLIRGEVLSLRNRDYVDAARVLGASNGRIMLRHLVPNVIPTVVIWSSLIVPSLILTEAALSFLGFGVQIPTPSWGNMLQDATAFYTRSAWNVFLPGFAIFLTVLAINLVGNGLRDALDPRLTD